MNAAARSQGAAARQSVTDAYRGQLRLLRDRADQFWLGRAAGAGPGRCRLRASGLPATSCGKASPIPWCSPITPRLPGKRSPTIRCRRAPEWQTASATGADFRQIGGGRWKPSAHRTVRPQRRGSRPARHRRRSAAWSVRAIKRQPSGLSGDTSSPADLAAMTGATPLSPPTNCSWVCACSSPPIPATLPRRNAWLTC